MNTLIKKTLVLFVFFQAACSTTILQAAAGSDDDGSLPHLSICSKVDNPVWSLFQRWQKIADTLTGDHQPQQAEKCASLLASIMEALRTDARYNEWLNRHYSLCEAKRLPFIDRVRAYNRFYAEHYKGPE